MTIARSPQKIGRRAAFGIMVTAATGFALAMISSDAWVHASWVTQLFVTLLMFGVFVSGMFAITETYALFAGSGDIELSRAGFRVLPKDVGDELWKNCGEFEAARGLFVAVRYRVHASEQFDSDGQPELNRTLANHYELEPKVLAETLNAFRDRALEGAVG